MRICKIEHGIRLLEQRLRAHHGSRWEHDEKRRFYMALDKVWKTVVEPRAKIIDIYREIREVIMANPRLCLFFEDDNLIKLLGLTDMLSGKRVSHDRIIQSALNQGNGPLLKQICYLFEKFELPRRRKRDEDRRKKLSEWRGRPTDDYTGMENTVTTKIETT